MTKASLRWLVGIALSAAFLWLAFRNVDLGAAVAEVRAVQWQGVALFAASVILMQLLRTLRWHLVLAPLVSISPWQTFRISSIGWLLIVALPFRLGELARPYLLKKDYGTPLSTGMATVAAERMADGLLVSLIFFVSTMRVARTEDVADGLFVAAVAALCLFSGGAIVLVLVGLLRHRTVALVERLPNWIGRHAGAVIKSFAQGLDGLPNARAWAAFGGLSLLCWGVCGLGHYALMDAFGWQLPLESGFVLVSVLAIGVMIPSGPGFLGTFQGAIAAGLMLMGIGSTEAAAFGLIAYPLTIGGQVLLGLPFLAMLDEVGKISSAH